MGNDTPHIGDLTADEYAQTIEAQLAARVCMQLTASFKRSDITNEDAFAIVRGRYLEDAAQPKLDWHLAHVMRRAEVPGGVDITFRVPLSGVAPVPAPSGGSDARLVVRGEGDLALDTASIVEQLHAPALATCFRCGSTVFTDEEIGTACQGTEGCEGMYGG